MKRHSVVSYLTAIALLATTLVGCDIAEPEPEIDRQPVDTIVEGVNFTTLFAPPTEEEVTSVTGDWAGRDVSAQNVAVQDIPLPPETAQLLDAELKIVTHDVAAASGDGTIRHAGAVIVPNNPAQPSDLPVFVYAHGGDDGVSIESFLGLVQGVVSSPDNVQAICALPIANCPGTSPEADQQAALQAVVSTAIHVIPAFRSENITFGGNPIAQAGGDPSPWDFDVDDTFALINSAIGEFDVLSANSPVSVLGVSRGGAVALLMSIRDDITPGTPDVVATVDFTGGPTSLISPFARDVTTAVLGGSQEVLALPGIPFLKENLIDPLQSGDLSEEDARPLMIRRSAAFFPGQIDEALQVHHGVEDPIVPIAQARLLRDQLASAGLTPDPADGDPFRYFEYQPVDDPSIYPNYNPQAGQHNPFLLDDDSDPSNGIAGLSRAGQFLLSFLLPPSP